MSTHAACTCLLIAAPALAGDVVVFRGAPASAGDVTIVDPAGISPAFVPPGLAGVALQSIDVNGRTQLDALRSDRAQVRFDVPNASRVLLPAGQGSLYRFARAEAGGMRHGLFVVSADGDARVVFEANGVGLAGATPPFSPRVAIAPDGSVVLVLMRFDQGGDALEIELATGAVTNRTASIAPLRLIPTGSHLNPTWGIFASTAGLFRYDRATAGDATPLVLPGPAPAWYSGQVAVNRSGSWAMTTAGDDDTASEVFVFDAAGPAVKVSNGPNWVSPAGFLPEHGHGPYFALSDDGSHCAWRTEGSAREAWLALVPSAVPPNSYWLTSDVNYMDTIDEIGQYMFRIGSDALVYAAGELSDAASPAIERVDFYQAQLPLGGGGPALLNVTQSSGLAAPPFDQPAEFDTFLASRDPAGDAVVFHTERSGGTGDLLLMQPGTPGVTILRADVKEVRSLERAGNHVFVGLQSALGTKPLELHHFTAPFAPSSGPLLSVNGMHTFERATPRADGRFAFIERTLVKERLWRFDPALGQLQLFTNRQLFYGPTISWTLTGELAFGVGDPATLTNFGLWSTAAPVARLPLANAPGFVLP
jgi:hypothetical protein